jgi:uncharacterized protein
MKILIAGGTGFIGQKLSLYCTSQGHKVQILSRSVRSGAKDLIQWDGQKIPDTAETPDILINLSGAGIADAAWTPKRRKVLYDSRILSTQACIAYMERRTEKPKLFINASAVGYYGFETQDFVDEQGSAGKDFLGELSVAWEQEAMQSKVPTLILRTGVVLGKEGGALPKLLPLFRMGLGGWLGSGKQGFPWIHIDDITASILYLAESGVTGPVNLVAPAYTDNKVFSKTLAEVLHRPCLFPAPGFVLQFVLGERADLVLKGQKVIPAKLVSSGYTFKFPTLKSALLDLAGW